MSRLLAVVFGFMIVYFLLMYNRKQAPHKDVLNGGESDHGETMVRCAHCGVHLPTGESIMVGHKSYCSEAHRRIDSGEPGQP